MKKFFEEFKKFITRGNVVDMAVGVIIGGAFTGIVNGLSNYILKPIINWLLALVLGDNGLESAVTVLSAAYQKDANGAFIVDELGNKIIDLSNSIYIDWGSFISAIINFFIVAFVLFCIVKTINKARDMGAHLEQKIKANKKLSKKEKALLEAQEKAKKEEEARLAEEKRKAEEEANKPTKTEALLMEIRDLLNKQK